MMTSLRSPAPTNVITFGFPVKALYDEQLTIAVLCVRGMQTNFFVKTQAQAEGESRSRLLLMKNDGACFVGAEIEHRPPVQKESPAVRLQSAKLAAHKQDGYLVEPDETGRNSLIGYSSSKGYQVSPDLAGRAGDPGRGPRVCAVQQLKNIVFAIGAVVALLVALYLHRDRPKNHTACFENIATCRTGGQVILTAT